MTMGGIKAFVKRFMRSVKTPLSPDDSVLDRFGVASVPCKWVDLLSDKELSELNRLLNWQCYVIDSHGRRFGNIAWGGKRSEPQAIPDRRIALMDERFHLAEKHVLEVGCFEGIHTVGLSMLAKKVTAIDSRIENVVKTIVRCAMFGCSPVVFKHDVEVLAANAKMPEVDVVHHVGVLYHLRDPVGHLIELGRCSRSGIMLDTHYCQEEEARDEYEVGGKCYRYKKYLESGYQDVFSGMYDHAKWLRLDDIRMVLREAGFASVDVLETRQERNGPRVLLFAEQG